MIPRIITKTQALNELYETTDQLWRAVNALTEQLNNCATDQDLIGATQDLVTRAELEEAIKTPFDA